MPVSPAAPLHSAPPPVRQPDNLRGLVLMMLGFAFFAACDVQAKVLTAEMHPIQIVWFRMIGLFLGVMVLLALRGRHLLRSKNVPLQMARGAAAVASAVCFTITVRHVPLADAVAVSFIAPFVVTVAGALVLKEPVGARRWAAVTIGFVGMLIIIRPGLGVFHPAIGFVVLAAFLFASRQIVSRYLAGSDSITTTVAYTSITATVLASVLLPFFWTTPTGWETWAIILGLTITAALGEVLVIRALDIAQAVVLAPLHYTLILWSTMYGFLVFGDLPDSWTLIGAAIIIASGLYTLHRERLAMQRKTSDQSQE